MLLVYYMIIINVIAFILYGVDKKKAENDKFRIPESRLILVSVLGGAFGAGLGMLLFHHKTRKTKFRITVPVCVVFYTVFMGFFLYNNYHIVTTEYEYPSFSVPKEMDGYTIVQISDLHNQLFGIDDSSIFKKIEDCGPDIIVVTGDVVDLSHTNFGLAEMFFKGAVDIAPVYYISGNHEKWLSEKKSARYEEFIQNIKGYGVNCIDDETIEIGDVKLVGVSEWSLGNRINISPDSTSGDATPGNSIIASETNDSGDISNDSNSNNTTSKKLIIMLAHEPQYVSSYEEAGADLVLVGHNHGGQIVIPGKGGLVSADFEFFPELCEGEHRFGDTTMIISRGLGNSLFPVRINNYPEIVKVVLRREEHKLMHLYMPDVVGSTGESAEAKLKDLGFFNVVIAYEKNDSVESGRVIRQSIPPDTTVSTEFEIVLYVAE